MTADIPARLEALRASLRMLMARQGTVNDVRARAELLGNAQEAAQDVLRDVVVACPNPSVRSRASDDRLTWGLDACGDAQDCPLERVSMDVAFVVGSLDRVEHDPAWMAAYLPQAAVRIDQILADWSSMACDLPDPNARGSCPGARARARLRAGR